MPSDPGEALKRGSLDEAGEAYVVGEVGDPATVESVHDAAGTAGTHPGRAANSAGSAALALRRDAERAVRHASLASWRALVVECDGGVLALAPLPGNTASVAVVLAPLAVAPERARRQVERVARKVGLARDGT